LLNVKSWHWSTPLHPRDKFGTFGRSVNFKNGKQAKKQRILDKVWVFAAHHKLEAIKRRKFSTLEQERRHTLLNYLTSDHYVERELVSNPPVLSPRYIEPQGASADLQTPWISPSPVTFLPRHKPATFTPVHHQPLQ